ncbi:MAG: hypothetical protein ACXABY_02525 [Candidatus Thorarchaeota archaeon]|jgi:hypothetical protein
MGIRLDATGGFEDLTPHVGHEIEVATYGRPNEVFNVAIECMTCNTVLLDFDNPMLEEDEA